MTGIVDLFVLLREMRPQLLPDVYAFCTVADSSPVALLALSPIGLFLEEEGWTVILRQEDARKAGLTPGPALRLITLTVQSSLEAVGLTADVAAALTRHGISANVVAAFHHDHIFVPAADAEKAMLALAQVEPVAVT